MDRNNSGHTETESNGEQNAVERMIHSAVNPRVDDDNERATLSRSRRSTVRYHIISSELTDSWAYRRGFIVD